MTMSFSWQGCLLIIAAIVLQTCACGAIMRPLEGPKKPRRKNICDRLVSS